MKQTAVLGLKDVIIMTVVGNLGIRWIAVAAGLGPISLLFWILGALLFFVPLALIVAELSRLYPEEGGMYAWTRRSLGERPAYMVAWLYWVNNIFYYPAILTFLASSLAYGIGKPELASNPIYINTCVLAAFWIILITCLFGIKSNKWISLFGGILGSFIPIAALIFLGFLSLIIYQHSATSFAFSNFIPHDTFFNNLSSLSIIMFAMAGVEVVPTLANSVRNPQRTLPRGLLAGAAFIFLAYALGTMAMNFIASPESLAKTTGLMQSFQLIDDRFGITWFTHLVAFLLVFAELAALGIWVIAPIMMFFKCTPTGILPDGLHKLNKKGVPQNALLLMGVLVSAILLLTNLLPTVNQMYQVLILMSTVSYFIPYLFLAVAYIKIRRAHTKVLINKPLAWLIALLTFASVCLGIMLSFAPTSDINTTHDLIVYEAELILGPFLFIVMGLLIYAKRKRLPA